MEARNLIRATDVDGATSGTKERLIPSVKAVRGSVANILGNRALLSKGHSLFRRKVHHDEAVSASFTSIAYASLFAICE
jgi:hypothetical protein